MNNSIKKYLINENVKLIDAMKNLSDIGSKILFVTDGAKLLGTLTDGDIRRYLINKGDLNQIVAKIANFNPKYLINVSHKDVLQFLF